MARKYGKKAQSKVERAMHERKRGKLRSGRSGKKVTSRKQAIAIGLSEARKAGAKLPSRSKKSDRGRGSNKRSDARGHGNGRRSGARSRSRRSSASARSS